MLTCLDLSEVAGCIRSISEHCMTANKARDTEDWLAREWLSEVVSQVSQHCMTANKARDTEDWLAREWLSEEVS